MRPVAEVRSDVQAEIKQVDDKEHEGVAKTEFLSSNDLPHHLLRVKIG